MITKTAVKKISDRHPETRIVTFECKMSALSSDNFF